jgi:hypothetical protein
MGIICRSSSLKLFAEVGDSSEAGLYVQRDPWALKPCLLHMTAACDGHTTEANTFAEYYPGYESEISPLYQRRWVFKEQVLSPRLLKFGHRLIQWECQGFAARESQPSAEDQPLRSLIEWVQLQYISELRPLLYDWGTDRECEITRRGIFECWCALVQDYCDRSLTYQSDNLLALAGIVRIIARNHKLTYINGLWEEDYCAGLLWTFMKQVDQAEYLFATVADLSCPS